MTLQTLHIRLARDAGGYPPFDFEEVAAVEIGDHLFRLVRPPAFAHGLAAGDVVMIQHHPYEALKTGRGIDWDLDVGVLSDEHAGQLGERFP